MQTAVFFLPGGTPTTRKCYAFVCFFIWQITVQARLLPNKKSNLKVLFRLRVVGSG